MDLPWLKSRGPLRHGKPHGGEAFKSLFQKLEWAFLLGERSQWFLGNFFKWRGRFDPAKGIDPADIGALDQKFRQERGRIEGALLAMPEMLNKLREQALIKRKALRPQIEEVAKAFAQAKADLAAFG
jgi:hypothetical protein